MALGFEGIIWYLFLLDSLGATITSLCCAKWYKKKFRWGHKHFPVTRGWCVAYLVLVLWVGTALNRLGLLGF